MKRILLAVAAIALTSCATTTSKTRTLASTQTCAFKDCRITSIHHHAIYNGNQFPE